MSLALIGKTHSYEFRWRRWALLRDTLDILVESKRFPWFHAIGSLPREKSRVPAAELAREVDEVTRLFRGRSTRVLAISPNTAAVLYLGAALPEPRPLTRFERKQIAPASDGEDLAQYFGSMCESILEVCERPLEDGTVEVVDV